jgi:hypothetical protein
MKCIKSIKPTKNTEVGQIVRIDDIDAESKVKTGYWAYVAKSEWKSSRGKKVVEEKTNAVEESTKKTNPKQSSREGYDESQPFVKTRKKSK